MSYPSSVAQVTTEVRVLLRDFGSSKVTDTEIQNWVKTGTNMVSSKTIANNRWNTIAITPNKLEYDMASDLLGAPGIKSNKIHGVWHQTVSTVTGLIKISNKMFGYEEAYIAGEDPVYWYQFGNLLGVFPVSTVIQAARGDGLQVYYSAVTDDVTALPNEYTNLVVQYAVAQGFFKKGNFESAAHYQRTYSSGIDKLSLDIKSRIVDADADLFIPDITEVLQ